MASEISTSSPPARVAVLVPLALPEPYDYAVPPDLVLAPGDYVVVPLGAQQLIGVVWGAGTDAVERKRLKSVIERLDAPPMPEALRRFVDWVAGYTLAPRGSVLRLAIRAPGALEPPRSRIACRLTDIRPARMTPARQRVVATAGDGFARSIR